MLGGVNSGLIILLNPFLTLPNIDPRNPRIFGKALIFLNLSFNSPLLLYVLL